MSKQDNPDNGRRDFIVNSGKVGLATGMFGAAVGCANTIQESADSNAKALSPDTAELKYSDNYWNRDTYAKLVGDLDFGKQRFGSVSYTHLTLPTIYSV